MATRWTIWNVDAAKPVRSSLPYSRAIRYAGLLETLFGRHYTVVKG